MDGLSLATDGIICPIGTLTELKSGLPFNISLTQNPKKISIKQSENKVSLEIKRNNLSLNLKDSLKINTNIPSLKISLKKCEE